MKAATKTWEPIDTFNFLLERDGKDKTILYIKQSLKCYRSAVLDKTKYGMYKEKYIRSYLAWKRLYFGAL